MFSYFGNCNNPWESLVLFEAAKEGLIPSIEHRLTDYERKNIVSGAIFIWDERRSSIRRWTDGIAWSNSRVVGDFLEYRELLPEAKSDSRPSRFTVKPYGLCKRTLCLASSDDPSESRLRLIAYYTKRDALSGNLPIPSQNPQFAGVVARLEKIYGQQRQAGGASAFSSVLRRNPSPTRDRRRSRKGLPRAEKTEDNVIEKSSEDQVESPVEKSPAQPMTLTGAQHEESHSIQENGVSSTSPNTNDKGGDCCSSPDNLHNHTVVLSFEAEVRPSQLPSHLPGTSPQGFLTAANMSGFEQLLLSSLRARLDSQVAGPQISTLPFLPQPSANNRFGRMTSEDRRQLGKLDNCNALF